MRITCFFLLLFLGFTYSSAQEIDSLSSGSKIKSAEQFLDSGRNKSALLILNTISRSDTNYTLALYKKALCFKADSQFNKVIECAQLALSENPHSSLIPDFYLIYGNAYTELKQYDRAINVWNEALRIYPDYPLLNFYKSVTLLHNQQNQEGENLIQKIILLNPYLYTAHFNLGIAAIRQGKIVPAFLSFMTYLLLNPKGPYAKEAISYLDGIARGKDYILGFRKNRTQKPIREFLDLENIILSKIALDKEYKPITALDDPISRQIQVSFEKLETKSSDTDFYLQYYMPFYKQVYNGGSFEILINHIFSGVEIASIQTFNKKKEKEINNWINLAANYFDKIKHTHILNLMGRDTAQLTYHYSPGDTLWGKGHYSNDLKVKSGYWRFYFNNSGRLEAEGNYNQEGNKVGVWKYYFFSGELRAVENFANGILIGKQFTYYINGNTKSEEEYKNNQPEGWVTYYFYNGIKEHEIQYALGKKEGIEKKFYPNGALKKVLRYTNGIENGPVENYYKTGPLSQKYTMVNGKIEGMVYSYYENGVLKSIGSNKEGKDDGDWKFYYENSNLKQSLHFVSDIEDGIQINYYENGKVSDSGKVVKGKIEGEYTYFTKEGKIYSKQVFKNGILILEKSIMPSGSERVYSRNKDGILDLISYSADGNKIAHFKENSSGEIEGLDSVFYESGLIHQINNYQNGELNGISRTFYQNGKLRSEVYVKNGEDEGPYKEYFPNGILSKKGYYLNGKEDGEWRTYFENGKINTIRFYQDEEISGYSSYYHPDGKLYLEEKYVLGWLEKYTQYDTNGRIIKKDSFPNLSGHYLQVHMNGAKWKEGHYTHGDYDGAFTSFYFNGTLESKYFYKQGAPDSLFESYQPNGVISLQGYYNKGSRSGIWKHFENGKLDYDIHYFPDSHRNEFSFYSENGKKNYVSNYLEDEEDGLTSSYEDDGLLGYQIQFEEGKAKSYSYLGPKGLMPFIPILPNNGIMKSFFPNGQVSRISTFFDGEENGKHLVYFTNGKIQVEDNRSFGLIEGPRKEYFKNGFLKIQENYLDNNLEGEYREYFMNGKLKVLGHYNLGEKNGNWVYFNENGKKIKTEYYYFDELLSLHNEN